MIYNGNNNPNTLEVNVTGLSTGSIYSFQVLAINYNGLGPLSNELQQIVCLPPASLVTPFYLSSTTQSINLGWSAPLFDGGCPIYSYQLWRNNGDGTTPSIQVDSTIITGKPYLTSYNVTGLTNTGLPYLFYLVALNEVGSVTSSTVSIILAAVPDTPTNIVTQIYAESSGS